MKIYAIDAVAAGFLCCRDYWKDGIEAALELEKLKQENAVEHWFDGFSLEELELEGPEQDFIYEVHWRNREFENEGREIYLSAVKAQIAKNKYERHCETSIDKIYLKTLVKES